MSSTDAAAPAQANDPATLVDAVCLDHTCASTAMGPFLSKNAGEALRAAGALSTVGLAFVLALVIGFWFGSLVDGWVGTKPIFTIAFFFVGLAAGILNVYRIVSQAYPVQAGRPASGPAPAGPREADAERSPMPGPGDGPDDHELADDER